MTNASFLWNNMFDIGTLTASSAHPNFPAANTRRRWASETWRSRYGDNTEWGNFAIVTGSNDKIDFEETIANELTATLAAGTYGADELCTQIKTQLDAAGASTYTVTYSDATNKFTLASNRAGGGGTFKILWLTGTNTATSAGPTIGFDITADDADAASHTADDLRIHSEEWLKVDAASAIDVQAFLFKKHNLSTSATAKIQGHTADAWTAPDVDVTLSLTSDITIYFWSSVQSKRWWRYYINDVENSDLYVETGRIFLGEYSSPDINMHKNYGKRYNDPSEIIISDGGQISTNKKTKYTTMSLVFEYTSAADLAAFESMWDSIGSTEEFFFTRDRDSASSTTIYMRVADMTTEHIQMDDLFVVSFVLEELR